MSLVINLLAELDRTQGLLATEFPDCRIGYTYRPDGVQWIAQIGPALQASDPETLRGAIREALARLRESGSSEQERSGHDQDPERRANP